MTRKLDPEKFEYTTDELRKAIKKARTVFVLVTALLEGYSFEIKISKRVAIEMIEDKPGQTFRANSYDGNDLTLGG